MFGGTIRTLSRLAREILSSLADRQGWGLFLLMAAYYSLTLGRYDSTGFINSTTRAGPLLLASRIGFSLCSVHVGSLDFVGKSDQRHGFMEFPVGYRWRYLA